MADKNYGVYGAVRLDDGRKAVFISAGYHWGCCQHGEVLFADGHLELVDPDTISRCADGPYSFNSFWYSWHRKRLPVKAFERYADLKAAYEEYNARGYEANAERDAPLRAALPLHGWSSLGPHYPWPYRLSQAASATA